MAVRVAHSKQAMKGYRLLKCEDSARYYTCFETVMDCKCTNDWVLDKAGVSRNLLVYRLTGFIRCHRDKLPTVARQRLTKCQKLGKSVGSIDRAIAIINRLAFWPT